MKTCPKERDVAKLVMQSTVHLPQFSLKPGLCITGFSPPDIQFSSHRFGFGKIHVFSKLRSFRSNSGGEGVSQAHLRDVWRFGDFLLVWPGQADPSAAAWWAGDAGDFCQVANMWLGLLDEENQMDPPPFWRVETCRNQSFLQIFVVFRFNQANGWISKGEQWWAVAKAQKTMACLYLQKNSGKFWEVPLYCSCTEVYCFNFWWMA